MADLAERAQVSKASVAYQPATEPGRSCGSCIMYHRGSCDLVAGPIVPSAVCNKWEERLPLADAAAEAYLSGWALTDAPWTERVQAGQLAAVAAALEHPDHPGVLEATLHLGQLDGIWATIYQRREQLLARHAKRILAAWRTLIRDLDPAVVVRSFRREAYLTTEAATKDPEKRWWQELGAAAALGWLRSLYQHDGYDALVAALADAIRAGMAEGEAGALALVAARHGRDGFRIDRAFKTAYQRLADDHAITRKAADAARRLIDSAAGDVGRRLAKLAGDDAGSDDMTAGVKDVMSSGQAPDRGADWAVYGSVLAGAVALYSRLSDGTQTEPAEPAEPEEPADGEEPGAAGPDTPPGGGSGGGQILLDWITAGDDRVEAVCQGYEDNSPYTPEQVPDWPHPRCRCSIDLSPDSGYSSLLGALLDSFAN